MSKTEKYGIGTIHENKHGEKFEIIGKCNDYNYRLIKFLDLYKYIGEAHLSSIRQMQVKNPYRKSVLGIGYHGEGIDFSKLRCDSRHPLYTTWLRLLDRCYNTKHNKYHLYGAKGVTVCEEWHSFSNFVYDITGMYNGDLLYQSKIIENYKGIKYALDKDSTKSKIYSEDTIKIIPMKINSGLCNIKDEGRKSEIMQDILDNEKATNWVCGTNKGLFL
ncbi:hypothetical protein CHL78_012060 [Romboutsia weinsteinii]|uniref:Uncharacterized protein n=1 Tax=Romboutsia weinsteinii TaxID=2020949 RepID=A0A371J2A1_9FIRM|nr:hypothetical protein [Romboutsia weinsteinii]RDY26798.1 hypothetical protein CHL78_012060 [Romboutsia weinsteinii]